MKAFFLAALLIAAHFSKAQYYYKDIIGTRESAELVNQYLKNKVSRVVLTSFDADNVKDDNFLVEQVFSPTARSLKTITSSSSTNAAILISYFDEKGNIIRTVDSSNVLVSATTYRYNNNGQLVAVISNSSDSAKSSGMSEQHLWEWNGNIPVRMLRIKNGRDTVFVSFKTDEQGRVIEEQETFRKTKSFPIFYYYNENGWLTDIARFNPRAEQVLPDYMFEYSEKGQVIQKITVPANNSEYLIWRYQYNSNGLKTKEAIYNKQKKLNGKIEYQYSFGS